MVVELDPVPDQATGMLQRFEAVRRDELLAQPVALDQCGEAAAGEDRPLSERSRNGSGTLFTAFQQFDRYLFKYK